MEGTPVAATSSTPSASSSPISTFQEAKAIVDALLEHSAQHFRRSVKGGCLSRKRGVKLVGVKKAIALCARVAAKDDYKIAAYDDGDRIHCLCIGRLDVAVPSSLVTFDQRALHARDNSLSDAHDALSIGFELFRGFPLIPMAREILVGHSSVRFSQERDKLVAGVADLLMWDAEERCFVLVDFKTMTEDWKQFPLGFRFLKRNSILQLHAYALLIERMSAGRIVVKYMLLVGYDPYDEKTYGIWKIRPWKCEHLLRTSFEDDERATQAFYTAFYRGEEQDPDLKGRRLCSTQVYDRDCWGVVKASLKRNPLIFDADAPVPDDLASRFGALSVAPRGESQAPAVATILSLARRFAEGDIEYDDEDDDEEEGGHDAAQGDETDENPGASVPVTRTDRLAFEEGDARNFIRSPTGEFYDLRRVFSSQEQTSGRGVTAGDLAYMQSARLRRQQRDLAVLGEELYLAVHGTLPGLAPTVDGMLDCTDAGAQLARIQKQQNSPADKTQSRK